MTIIIQRADHGPQLNHKSAAAGVVYFTDEGHGEFLLNLRGATFRFNPEEGFLDVFKNGHFRIAYQGDRINGTPLAAFMRMEYEQLLGVAGYASTF